MSTLARSRAKPASKSSKPSKPSTQTSTSKKTRPVRTTRDDDDDDDDDAVDDAHDDDMQDVEGSDDADGDIDVDDDDEITSDAEEQSQSQSHSADDSPTNDNDDDGGLDEPDEFSNEMETHDQTTFGSTLHALLTQPIDNAQKPVLGLKSHKLDEIEVSSKQLKHESKIKRMRAVEKRALLEKDHIIKPEFTEKERKLRQIATRGVVTLFNAVTKQQRSLRETEESSGVSKDRVSSLSKDGFLQLLKQESNNVQAAPSRKRKQDDDEQDKDDNENAPTWKALKQDYMMGGNKLKDWDKQISSDEDDDEHGDGDGQEAGDGSGDDDGSD